MPEPNSDRPTGKPISMERPAPISIMTSPSDMRQIRSFQRGETSTATFTSIFSGSTMKKMK